jgi:hypothetical protein
VALVTPECRISEVPHNGAVKLPAPLALLVGRRSFGFHLSMQPAQGQSAPQLTASVKPLTSAVVATLLGHP